MRYGASDWEASSVLFNDGTNIGIGETSPDSKLHVVGKIKQVDGQQADGFVLVSDADGVATWTDPAEIPGPDVSSPVAIRHQGDIIYVYPSDIDSTGLTNGLYWSYANGASCQALPTVDGHGSWRMPTLSELDAIYKQAYLIPGLDLTGEALYWSTSYSGGDYYAVRMSDGARDLDPNGTSTYKAFNQKKRVRCISDN